MMKTGTFDSVILVLSSLASLWSLVSRVSSDDKSKLKDVWHRHEFSFKRLKKCKCCSYKVKYNKSIEEMNGNNNSSTGYIIKSEVAFCQTNIDTPNEIIERGCVNWRWLFRIFCWRFIEISNRIAILLLVWFNLGGIALFIVLFAEFLLLIIQVIKTKRPDPLGGLMYIVNMGSTWILYRISTHILYMILITIFATVNFDAWKVPDYSERNYITMVYSGGKLLFIWAWITTFINIISLYIIKKYAYESPTARAITIYLKEGLVQDVAELMIFGTILDTQLMNQELLDSTFKSCCKSKTSASIIVLARIVQQFQDNLSKLNINANQSVLIGLGYLHEHDKDLLRICEVLYTPDTYMVSDTIINDLYLYVSNLTNDNIFGLKYLLDYKLDYDSDEHRELRAFVKQGIIKLFDNDQFDVTFETVFDYLMNFINIDQDLVESLIQMYSQSKLLSKNVIKSSRILKKFIETNNDLSINYEDCLLKGFDLLFLNNNNQYKQMIGDYFVVIYRTKVPEPSIQKILQLLLKIETYNTTNKFTRYKLIKIIKDQNLFESEVTKFIESNKNESKANDLSVYLRGFLMENNKN